MVVERAPEATGKAVGAAGWMVQEHVEEGWAMRMVVEVATVASATAVVATAMAAAAMAAAATMVAAAKMLVSATAAETVPVVMATVEAVEADMDPVESVEVESVMATCGEAGWAMRMVVGEAAMAAAARAAA